jgi:hypothetical protein
MSSGKWYCEATVTSISGTLYARAGIATQAVNINNYLGVDPGGWASISNSGNKEHNTISVAYGSSWTSNDVIGITFDADVGTLTFYKNNVSQGTAYTSLTSGPYFFAFSMNDPSVMYINFGQRPFAYTAPSGFKALVTTNLPTPTIGATSATLAGKYFNTVLYPGNTPSTNAITGVGFAPDWVWVKSRTVAEPSNLVDRVRGDNLRLKSSTTDAESAATFALNSDGFTVGANSESNTGSMVAWNWKANGAGVSNTAGTIPGTVTVSANTIAGISIVTYTGNNTAGATVGHGLGSVPSWMIVKRRTGSASDDWLHYHVSLGATKSMAFDTAVATTSSTRWNDTTPSSAVLTIGNSTGVNASGAPYVAYCFAEVEGFSKFGSYTGNGSADGPFVYTGFRPAWVMIKGSGQISNWQMLDTARNPFNAAQNFLRANSSNAEASLYPVDINSNGFKIRTTDSDYNTNVQNYIYMAFAENPFKYSLAR